MFSAILLEKDDEGLVTTRLQELPKSRLPEGDVTVAAGNGLHTLARQLTCPQLIVAGLLNSIGDGAAKDQHDDNKQ